MEHPESAEGAGADDGKSPNSNRRIEWDRRATPTHVWDSFRRGWKRRADARRVSELEGSYVDVYQPKDLGLLLCILLLNVMDAFFTLGWLQMGGREANAFMEWVLGFGNWVFLVQKCLVVGVWLIVLTVHKNFRVARIGLWSLFSLYSLVILYHFALRSAAATSG